jgi:hypothetical protein
MLIPDVRSQDTLTAFTLETPESLPATNGYSHLASIAPGSQLVWTSGQLPIDVDGAVVRTPAGRPRLS